MNNATPFYMRRQLYITPIIWFYMRKASRTGGFFCVCLFFAEKAKKKPCGSCRKAF
jgi:hypothetical protein